MLHTVLPRIHLHSAHVPSLLTCNWTSVVEVLTCFLTSQLTCSSYTVLLKPPSPFQLHATCSRAVFTYHNRVCYSSLLSLAKGSILLTLLDPKQPYRAVGICHPLAVMASIQDCNDEDAERAFQIISETSQHTQPYIHTLFPKLNSPEGYEQGKNRLLERGGNIVERHGLVHEWRHQTFEAGFLKYIPKS